MQKQEKHAFVQQKEIEDRFLFSVFYLFSINGGKADYCFYSVFYDTHTGLFASPV